VVVDDPIDCTICFSLHLIVAIFAQCFVLSLANSLHFFLFVTFI